MLFRKFVTATTIASALTLSTASMAAGASAPATPVVASASAQGDHVGILGTPWLVFFMSAAILATTIKVATDDTSTPVSP